MIHTEFFSNRVVDIVLESLSQEGLGIVGTNLGSDSMGQATALSRVKFYNSIDPDLYLYAKIKKNIQENGMYCYIYDKCTIYI